MHITKQLYLILILNIIIGQTITYTQQDNNTQPNILSTIHSSFISKINPVYFVVASTGALLIAFLTNNTTKPGSSKPTKPKKSTKQFEIKQSTSDNKILETTDTNTKKQEDLKIATIADNLTDTKDNSFINEFTENMVDYTNPFDPNCI